MIKYRFYLDGDVKRLFIGKGTTENEAYYLFLTHYLENGKEVFNYSEIPEEDVKTSGNLITFLNGKRDSFEGYYHSQGCTSKLFEECKKIWDNALENSVAELN